MQALRNGALLPVVLSINCSSAAYDYDETSFAGESLVKADGGSVGVFGDTRDSPSWHNSQIALGFVDALLPSVLAGEGPATKQRTGDALIHGKLRLAGMAPPDRDGNTRNELYLWHYFGDPSMQMWGGGHPPKAFVNGDGTATIPAAFGDGSVKPGELEIAIEGDGAQPVKVTVSDVPPPDLVISELTESSIAVKNQGAGGAGPFKATIVDSQRQTLTFNFDGLAAGASATRQFSCGDLLRSRSATVDSDGRVAESVETNNGASGVFDCTG